jgi:hypothetical protein
MPTPQDLELQMFLGGVWTAVPLYSGRAAKITRGQDPGSQWPRPTKVEVEINNDSLDYDPSRPESPLYGIAGRNTRTRVMMGVNPRTWTEATSWRPERTIEHQPGANRGRSSTLLTAEGLLRRVGTWTEPLRSPLYRTNVARTATLIGYWPLEDDRNAQTLTNTTTGPAATFSGVTLADDEGPLGGGTVVRLSDTSVIAGKFLPASTTAGWQVSFSMRLAAVPSGGTHRELLSWATSNGYRWTWSTNDSTFKFMVIDSDGTTMYDSGAVTFGSSPTEWTNFRAKCSVSGGTVTVDLWWYAQSDEFLWTFGGGTTFSGTLGALTSWRVVGNTAVEDGWVGHVFGVTTIVDDLLTGPNLAAFNGYLGETAWARFARLTFQAGLTRYAIGGSAETQPMGPQRPDTLINLLKQCVDTDDCMIYDEVSDIALTIRTRRTMLSQTPALELTYGVDVAGYDKLIDDLDTTNVVTIKNLDGGEVTVTLAAGPMSVLPPPDGVGEYRGGSDLDINAAETGDQLEQIALWRLSKGTLDRPRYASVTVDLLANPEHEVACQGLRLGDLITIDGIEPYQVRLLVLGIEETVGAITRTFTFATAPYEPYDAGKYDDTAFRYDVRNSTTGTSRDATQTAWTFTAATISDLWSTTAEPYDLVVAGERITVSVMNAATGTGPYSQTATVARSVNGVVKTHAVGEPVHIATPGRYAL